MAEGWVKLHRTITDNWIWDNPHYLKWWLDLILMANHKERKILFNDSIRTVGIGERVTSEQKLSERWGVSRNTVRKFLNLLVKDDMISLKKSRQTGTTYKINNYNVYQGFSEEKKHQTEQRSEHQKDNELNINKNEKNEKNEKNNNIHDENSPMQEIVQIYESIFGMINSFVFQNLEQWCEDLSPELVLEALKRSKSANNFKYTENILKNWDSRGVKTVTDVENIDAEFKQRKGSWKKPTRSEPVPEWLDDPEGYNARKEAELMQRANDDLPF